MDSNFETLLKIAKHNKLSHLFLKEVCQKFPVFKTSKSSLLLDNEQKMRKIGDTLEFIHQSLNKQDQDFLLIKTLKVLPFETFDIDIATKDVALTKKLLMQNGAKESGGRFINVLTRLNLGSPGFNVNGLLSIDVYDDIPFSNLKVVDREFLWLNSSKKHLNGYDYQIPSPESDLIITIGSPLFTDRKLTYLDLLHITHLLENINMSVIEEQLKKYRWEKEFKSLLNLICNLRKKIIETKDFPVDIVFPYLLPNTTMFKALRGPVYMTAKNNPVSTFKIFSNVIFNCFFGQLYIFLLFI